MRKNSIIYLSILCLFASLFASCSDDDSTSPSPKLVVSADTIILQNDEVQKLLISLDGANECSYEILSYPDWVNVSPLSGLLLKKIQSIEIQPNAAYDTLGVYSGDLVIYSSLGTTNTVHLKRLVGVSLACNLPDSISIPMYDSNRNLTLRNQGSVDMSYKINTSNNNVLLSSSEGVIGGNSNENIKITVNRDVLETGIYYTKLFIDINDKKDTIDVKIDNLKESKIFLKSNVVSAQFSKITNKIVYVSSNPLALVIYDVKTKTSESITLGYVPTSLSISLDGQTAIVGHDAKLTYVDLSNKKIISTLDVPLAVNNVVLGNNKWVYITSTGNSYYYLYSMNLDDKVLYNSSSINSSSTIKLHPSGKYLYLYNSSSSYPFNKYDVQNGAVRYMYNNYSNSYSSSGGFDFSDDGKRIFVNNGVTLKTSESQSQDLIYNGTINNAGYIVGLANSSKNNNLYIINRSTDYYNQKNNNYVSIYNAENLQLKKQIELEKYIVKNNESGNSYNSVPQYIFTNTAGDKVYVLSNCNESGLLYNWSLQELDIK